MNGFSGQTPPETHGERAGDAATNTPLPVESRPTLTRHSWHDETRREWAVRGPHGAVSFWCHPCTYEGCISGGVEWHYGPEARPSYLDHSAHLAECRCTGSECWHEGASVWAEEHWIPHILPYGAEAIWANLEWLYNRDLRNAD